MKRIVLVMLVGLLPACDALSNPQDQREVTATVGGAGRTIGAVLLSVEGVVDSVAVTDGEGVVLARDGRTYVAAVLTTPGSTATLEMWGSQPNAPFTVVQVSDGDNLLYDDPSVFAVTTRED